MLKSGSNTKSSYLGIGIALGVAIGAGFGVALDNLALGIGPGIALGVAIALAMSGRRPDKADGPARDSRDDSDDGSA